jgi:hypothetical protein
MVMNAAIGIELLHCHYLETFAVSLGSAAQ